MAQVDVKDLDHSSDMMVFFDHVVRTLEESHWVSRARAEQLVSRYFDRNVQPLERALVMHRGVEQVAKDLSKGE